MIDKTMVQITAGITALVVVGTALALGTARQGPGDRLAAAGSPLYGIVVQESIKTLDQQPGGQEAEKSNVCPICGKVHPPAAAGAAAAAQQRPVAAGQPHAVPPSVDPQAVSHPAGGVCPICGQIHPLPSTPSPGHAIQAAPPGAPANSYYCPDCKAYHLRPVAGQTPVLNPHTPPLQLAPSP